MDVILLKEVEKLGAEGAVVHVKPGYARNYLIPRGLAVSATAQQLKMVETIRQQRMRKLQRMKADAEAIKQKLESRSLTLKLSVGADDKPFGSVTTHDVVDALSHEGIVIEKHAVRLEEPIKTLGVHEIPVRILPEVTATLKVWVVKA